MNGLRRFLTIVALICFATPARAGLMIDFGSAVAPIGGLEPGFSVFQVTNATNFVGTFFDYAGTGIDNGTPVRVTIDGVGTGGVTPPPNANQRLVTRNGTGWTGGMDALLIDWIGISGNGAETIVRLDNLAPGTYTLRSYHTDIGTGGGGNQAGNFDFFIDGVQHLDEFQIKGQVAAAPNDATAPNFFDVTFSTDGSTVDLTYRNTNGAFAFPVLNGFEVNKVSDGLTYRVDIDSTTTGTASTPITTAPGWTSLLATAAGDGASVSVHGATFTVISADGARNRTGNPDLLTRDFIFDDGAGEDVGLTVDGLQGGYYEVSIWGWDSNFPALGNQIVGFIEGAGPEQIIGSFTAHPTDPIVTFLFHADGFSQYTFFVREDNVLDRARFNAIEFVAVHIPEPATITLALLAGAGLLRRRRAVAE